MKRLLYLLAAVWFTALGTQHTMAQSTSTWTRAQYEALGAIVKWTDSQGNSHANMLTDVATDPYHIMALLKTAYTDQRVPGIIYGGYDKNGNRDGAVTYGNITGWGITSVTAPTTEGYTTFMVKVKNGWSSSQDEVCSTEADIREYIGKSVESVQLLTASMPVGGTNPGTLYKLSGEANRFFFMSKGRARSFGTTRADRTPFWGMYEEFSPVDLTASTGLTDFYTKMKNGNVYTVVHDCGSVLGTAHYFAMTGIDGTENRDVTGLTFFLSDYRLKYGEYTYVNNRNQKKTGDCRDEYKSVTNPWSTFTYENPTGGHYVNYNTAYAPTTGLYTAMLNAKAQASTTADKHYTVTLDWSTTLAKVLNGNSVTEAFHLYRVGTDGSLTEIPLTDSTATTLSYDVEQKAHGYTITYVVSAKPVDNAAGFDPVWSNRATVDIPGIDPNELLVLGIGGYTSSQYDQTQEINQYRNRVKMSNSVGTFIAADSVQAGARFTLYRTGINTDGSIDKCVPAAVVTVTGNASGTISYTVAYSNQSGAVDSEYPATEGTFSTNSKGAVDFGDFVMCDQFNVSTASNSHPISYDYQVRYAPDGNNERYHSNEHSVKVYKTVSQMTNAVTERQAKADLDHSLAVSSMPVIKFTVDNDNAINQYTVKRDDVSIGRAQNRPSGTYATFEVASDGSEHLTGESVANMATINDRTYLPTTAGNYVPVISVNYGTDTINTYGCDIKQGYQPKVTATENGKVMGNYELRTEGGKSLGARYFKTTINIEASVPQGLNVEAYRLWRNCGNKAVEELEEYSWRCDSLTPWYNGFGNSSRSSGNSNLAYRIESGSAYGEWMQISDQFGAKKPTADDPLDVIYHVRLYCSDAQGNYYVAEDVLPVTYTNSSPTGIIDVEGNERDLFAVTPAMATDHITVSGCQGTVVVRSLTGAEVMRLDSGSERNCTVNVTSLAPGCYIVSSGTASQRIVKR